MVSVGKRVENFTLPATGDQNLSLSDFRGRSLVIYFYPKDNTPGCTREGQDFRDLYPQFTKPVQTYSVSPGIRSERTKTSETNTSFHSTCYQTAMSYYANSLM